MGPRRVERWSAFKDVLDPMAIATKIRRLTPSEAKTGGNDVQVQDAWKEDLIVRVDIIPANNALLLRSFVLHVDRLFPSLRRDTPPFLAASLF